MFPEKIEESFHLNLEVIQLLQNSLKTSYLDAYTESIENIVDNYQVRVIDGVPDTETVGKIEALYQQIQEIPLEPEERRKLAQLLLLKGNKTEQLQPNHQLTPDSIGFIFVYLIEQLYSQKKLSILDLTAGMGNLLLTTLLNLKLAKYQVSGVGVDNDETLLAIAAANSEWMQADVQLFHQDGLQELLIEPMDLAIGDLPVGYYPNDEKAMSFVSAVKDTHSYAHHLLMEQAMNYVKEDGFGIFLVPSNILDSEQSEAFKKWLREVYLQGMIQLPDELFQNEQSRKSILIVQNKGEKAQQVAEVMLAKLPTLKDPKQVAKFFKQFEAWKASNL